MLPVPLNSWKMASSAREFVWTSAVATMVSEPAVRVLRAAAKSLRGISSAPVMMPPDWMPRPLPADLSPPIAALYARARRVMESMRMKTCSPASTRRLARSTHSSATRQWFLGPESFELA